MTAFQAKGAARLSPLLSRILEAIEPEQSDVGTAVAELSRLFTKEREALGTAYFLPLFAVSHAGHRPDFVIGRLGRSCAKPGCRRCTFLRGNDLRIAHRIRTSSQLGHA